MNFYLASYFLFFLLTGLHVQSATCTYGINQLICKESETSKPIFIDKFCFGNKENEKCLEFGTTDIKTKSSPEITPILADSAKISVTPTLGTNFYGKLKKYPTSFSLSLNDIKEKFIYQRWTPLADIILKDSQKLEDYLLLNIQQFSIDWSGVKKYGNRKSWIYVIPFYLLLHFQEASNEAKSIEQHLMGSISLSYENEIKGLIEFEYFDVVDNKEANAIKYDEKSLTKERERIQNIVMPALNQEIKDKLQLLLNEAIQAEKWKHPENLKSI